MQTEIQKIADTQWDRFCELFPKLVRFDTPKIVLNNRIYRTAGRCWVERNEIDLSSKLLANPKNKLAMLHVILPHELAHQVDFNLNGMPKNNRWHGRTWSEIMVKFGLPANPYHTLEI